MNEHEKTRRNLAALAAGTLPADEEARLRAHLAACPDCARQEQVWGGLLKAFARVPETTPTPARLARITALAQARREEVLAARWQKIVMTGLAVLGWAWFALVWPALWAARDWLVDWLALPPTTGTVLTMILWWLLSLTIGLALLPLLRQWETEWKEKVI
ncbi:zf-HC2 domain-containing protein [Acidobacteriia bacterium AH_259_A11_L15]|nr:zf-HC2 domain-containing protein [Acidobacteriia bacterium AH_259_A11_L15]